MPRKQSGRDEMDPLNSKAKHVVIVGGGAAGMSCAATLANHAHRFKVTVLEKSDVVGGQATSIPLDEQKYGAPWMNNGVQGGSKIFKHTFNFFRQQGFPAQEVQLQVAFGKGDAGFWTNVFPSKLVQRYAADVKKFGFFLKLIKWTMPVLGLVPISIMLRLLLFSKGFGDKMVYPLIALFLGTGNQTPNVPSAIVERLFDDPNMKLWDYDPVTLLPNLPTMFTFDHLHAFYGAWKTDLEGKGVTFRNGTEVHEVLSRTKHGVKLRVGDVASGSSTEETFDDVVFCVLADDALRILGRQATWREKLVLGGAAFYDDITVTHTDRAYFEKQYETTFKPELCAEPTSDFQKKQIAFAKGEGGSGSGGFRPMYYTFSYQQDPRLIEMSFNCSNYQHQLKKANEDAFGSRFEPVYQTIFLNKTLEHLWTIDDIDKSKVIKKNWWHQLGHRWQHYLRVVPGMMFINGRNRTSFAGSWTLVNMHELACVSGIAAAYRLGADYQHFDDFAQDFFAKYLLLSHGMIFSRQEKQRR
ncbi:FAD dependent oxidoreductase [Ophiocordyceps camponoti-floridani]|uniref:FAD dependent oxidoreductase n=1 Tax=Ophiocordyceps camponoti-floridani TaxID=2030778 RepID=A0A8H4Q2K4_9HYPO|nr:FAD dependent oxidoreductase [Ophiocordyceps camponoti-floridani]